MAEAIPRENSVSIFKKTRDNCVKASKVIAIRSDNRVEITDMLVAEYLLREDGVEWDKANIFINKLGETTEFTLTKRQVAMIRCFTNHYKQTHALW